MEVLPRKVPRHGAVLVKERRSTGEADTYDFERRPAFSDSI